MEDLQLVWHNSAQNVSSQFLIKSFMKLFAIWLWTRATKSGLSKCIGRVPETMKSGGLAISIPILPNNSQQRFILIVIRWLGKNLLDTIVYTYSSFRFQSAGEFAKLCCRYGLPMAKFSSSPLLDSRNLHSSTIIVTCSYSRSFRRMSSTFVAVWSGRCCRRPSIYRKKLSVYRSFLLGSVHIILLTIIMSPCTLEKKLRQNQLHLSALNGVRFSDQTIFVHLHTDI